MDRWRAAGLTMAAIGLAGGGGAIGWSMWDRKTNYVAVPANVVAVAEDCTLERTSYDQNDNPRTDREGPMACAEAERLRREDSSRRDFELRRQRIVRVRFVSPADGRAHIGTLRPRDGYLADAAPGASAEILAHRRKAEKVGLAP